MIKKDTKFLDKYFDNFKKLINFNSDEIKKKLGNLKNNERALEGGKNSATYERIKTSKDTSVLAFKRSKEGNEFIYVANLSSKPVKFTLPVSGPFMDVMKDQTIDIVENEEHEFSPWQYLILRKQ